MYDSGATLDCTPHPAEAALEALFSTPQGLLDLLPMAVTIYRANGTPARHNRRALELWRCAPAPAGEAGPCCCGSLTLFLPDGTPLAPEATPVHLALRQGTATSGQPILIERPDRSRTFATISAAPVLDADARVIGAVSCVQDTPQQPRRDIPPADTAELAAIYEHAGVGIGETDASGRLLRVNEAFCALTGYSRQELLSLNISALVTEEDRAREHEFYVRQVAGQLDRYTLEQRHIRKDGTQLWVSVTSSAVRSVEDGYLYSVRVAQDITQFKQVQERQQMLMGELNHRIKNTLATVQSLAYQTVRKTPDAHTFYEKFQGRLMALSKAHSLLTRSQWSGAALRDIIEDQVLPYREGEGRRIILTGDAVELTADQAVVLGMVFHELVTNAIKHGSLSQPTGGVRIEWHVIANPADGQPLLHLLWRESGGPPAHLPRTHGFGSLFIERSTRDQLHGSAHMEFLPTGLSCRLEIPLRPNMEKHA
ncbi:sensor histidine kinase [Pedomonas mirosovicensis]|uniref:sensor histidine kinase n=1 Tax=Pedomonas mirosovicensis TaxID=2908641 RepID=UPI002168087C|nr:HWE histidine kinase domain-containing protein [Pedomonas mirosovicensis]MCH8684997.1 PAS domain S-box protein [Pedomonas mirosovicensis]